MIRYPFVLACLAVMWCQPPQDPDLLKTLPTSKISLRDGVQQLSKGSEVPISAKFEIEDGVFQLSVYAAGKGVCEPADHNELKEYAGDPKAATWQPKAEVFSDVEHVARSAQQMTLLAVSQCTLLDVLAKAEKEQTGVVYSIAPILSDRKPRFRLLFADQGKTRELIYDAVTREVVKASDAGAKK
jgi:hypothetical protein